MDRKAALKRLKKIALESRAILDALAQDAAQPLAAPMPGGATQVNKAGLEAAVKSKLETLMPGASGQINSLTLGDVEGMKPLVFLNYKSSPNSNALKAAVIQAAKEVLKKDVSLQGTGQF